MTEGFGKIADLASCPKLPIRSRKEAKAFKKNSFFRKKIIPDHDSFVPDALDILTLKYNLPHYQLRDTAVLEDFQHVVNTDSETVLVNTYDKKEVLRGWIKQQADRKGAKRCGRKRLRFSTRKLQVLHY